MQVLFISNYFKKCCYFICQLLLLQGFMQLALEERGRLLSSLINHCCSLRNSWSIYLCKKNKAKLTQANFFFHNPNYTSPKQSDVDAIILYDALSFNLENSCPRYKWKTIWMSLMIQFFYLLSFLFQFWCNHYFTVLDFSISSPSFVLTAQSLKNKMQKSLFTEINGSIQQWQNPN